MAVDDSTRNEGSFKEAIYSVAVADSTGSDVYLNPVV